MKISLFILSLCIACVVGDWYTVYYGGSQTYSVKPGKDELNGVAWTEFVDDRFKTGWARVNLESSVIYADQIQAYGSGYLEGYVTYDLIWLNYYDAVMNSYTNGVVPSSLRAWFTTNYNWINVQIASQVNDPYWIQVNLTMQQLSGMAAGYNAAQSNASKKLDIIDFIYLNANGDEETLSNLLGITSPSSLNVTGVGIGTHCSSLIKVTDDYSELYSGHTTWADFFTMLRIYKQYTLNFAAKGTVAKTTLFSSYPGYLSSVDDFYQLSSKIVVTETTNGCFNMTLIKEKVVTSSLLSWLRVVVANRMATDGETWIQTFSKYNSGTYNNQWIIVDYNKFEPYSPLAPGTLYIAEQMPGTVLSQDVTDYLRLGYWPSYNVPFFSYNYEKCGFTPMKQQYGNWFTYDLAPRAEIFRRQANEVTDIWGEMDFLRYNNWKTDPLAAGSPGNQISARLDLVPVGSHPVNPYLVRAAFGGIDSKATSNFLVNVGINYAQSGPTLGGAKNVLPPFDWRDWPSIVHDGMPDVFDFDWIAVPSGIPIRR